MEEHSDDWKETHKFMNIKKEEEVAPTPPPTIERVEEPIVPVKKNKRGY